MNEPLTYSIKIEANKMNSDFIITVALLEKIKELHPKEFIIAVKALQELEDK